MALDQVVVRPIAESATSSRAKKEAGSKNSTSTYQSGPSDLCSCAETMVSSLFSPASPLLNGLRFVG